LRRRTLPRSAGWRGSSYGEKPGANTFVIASGETTRCWCIHASGRASSAAAHRPTRHVKSERRICTRMSGEPAPSRENPDPVMRSHARSASAREVPFGVQRALAIAVAIGGACSSRLAAGDPGAAKRAALVEIVARWVDDPHVLAAIGRVRRDEMVPADVRARAYDDVALPIGLGQTISQPSLVGVMTALAAVGPRARVLEIGTGSGYQAAVLAELAGTVYTIEIVPELARRARATLDRLGYRNIRFRIGDGWAGWPEAAPFDAIVVTAAAPAVPPHLLAQLKVGGHLIVPVGGDDDQMLHVVTRTASGYDDRAVLDVAFVLMTGAARAD